MPPFGVFASEFLILTTAMREHPWATPILLVALGVASPPISDACSRWSSATRACRGSRTNRRSRPSSSTWRSR
jgi:hypothetical protein